MEKDADPAITRRQSENVRAYIAKRAREMADALIEHGMGNREMTPSQVKAIQVALDRVLPSMQSIDQTTHNEAPDMTPEELDAMLKQAVRDMARKDPNAIKALLEEPQLQVIAGGKA